MKSKNLDNPWLVPLLLMLIPSIGLIAGTILGPQFLEIANDPSPAVLDQYGNGDFGPYIVGAVVGLGLGVVIALWTIFALNYQANRAAKAADQGHEEAAAGH